MDLWSRIKGLEGKTLYTLGQCKEFEVVAVARLELIVRPVNSIHEWTIRKEEITGTFLALKKESCLYLDQIASLSSSHNASYVAAILAEHPCVFPYRKNVRIQFNSVKIASVEKYARRDGIKGETELIEVTECVMQMAFWMDQYDDSSEI